MFSLCLTNYERFDLLIESFAQVYDDPRIVEIVISDDCSSEEVYLQLVEYCRDKTKIKLFRNEQNVGMSLNKKMAIERATQEWCILFDSDNVLPIAYISKLAESLRYLRRPNIIHVPDSGGTNLDYRHLAMYVSPENIHYFLSLRKSGMLLNTCNYCVNRERYLSVYEYNPSIKGSDTIWFNYLWLKKGGGFRVVSDMQYFHRIHAGSGYMQDLEYNQQKCDEIMELIKKI